MTNSNTIFQRTHEGREEIHKKSQGLTQSERLVLIMIDGVSSYSQVRAKLSSLTDERFERALHKLQTKELVLEVFMPLEGQAPEEIEKTVIDRFLQQDPMDPVTIILHDPEDELGMLETVPQNSAQRQAPPRALVPFPVLEPEFSPTASSSVAKPKITLPEPALDSHHVQMADSLAEELRAKRATKPVSPPSQPRVTPSVQPQPAKAEVRPERPSPVTSVHWGYWLIVSGVSFILGFVLARMTS